METSSLLAEVSSAITMSASKISPVEHKLSRWSHKVQLQTAKKFHWESVSEDLTCVNWDRVQATNDIH